MEIKLDQKELKPIIDAEMQKIIMEALGKEPEKLIAEVVRQAMTTKSGNFPYNSLYRESVEKLIRETAIETFKVWLEGKKDVIRTAIVKRLKNEESQFFETVADQLVNGLAKSFFVTVNLKVED